MLHIQQERDYQRIMKVDQGSFTPLVLTANSVTADECKIFYLRLAPLLSIKHEVEKSQVATSIRTKIKYEVWYYVYVDPA